MRQVIDEDLGLDLFSEIDAEPIGSASLAQVHKARLVTGEIVAVKVQHRWIKEQIPGDIKLTKMGSALAKRIFKDDYKLGWLVEQIEKKLPHELDFRSEAANCRRAD